MIALFCFEDLLILKYLKVPIWGWHEASCGQLHLLADDLARTGVANTLIPFCPEIYILFFVSLTAVRDDLGGN